MFDQSTAAAASEGNALTSKNAAAGSATEAAASQADALTSKNVSGANAATAASANTNAQTALVGTASAAAQAATARDQANAAWAASMSPAETLPAISKTIHWGAIVKAIIYDTGRDTDGGAWRKRCADKSWYTETLGGTTWLGQAATAAAAWAISGAATGNYFQNTTDGKFYTLGASSTTVTEVFRGNVREFPEQVAIIAESARVVIYDLTQVGTPMWKSFVPAAVGTIGEGWWRSTLRLVTSIAATNGKVFFGLNFGAADDAAGLAYLDFVKDTAGRYPYNSANLGGVVSMAQRGSVALDKSLPLVVNSQVNDVAVTVLEDAPVDSATGLKIPTIAVFTDAGISVIHNTGTVINSSDSGIFKVGKIREFDGAMFATRGSTSSGVLYARSIGQLASAFALSNYNLGIAAITSTGNDAALKLTLMSGARLARGGNLNGVTLLQENPSAVTKNMVAYITNAYNTGWQVGDSRGAWLSDTVAETVTASGELVVNGSFDTDLAGWDLSSANTSATWVAGAARITDTGATTPGPRIFRAITGLVIGKSYSLEVSFSGTVPAGGLTIAASNNTSITGSLNSANSTANPSTVRLNFVAAATSHNMLVVINPSAVGQYADIDNVSAKLVSADRSVKNNGLTLNGTLTKSPVATGAQLVEYSGLGMDGSGNAMSYPGGANVALGSVLNSDFHASFWWDKKVVDQDFYLSTSGPKGYPYTSMADGMVISVNGGTGAKSVSLKGWSAGARADSASITLDGSIGLVKLDIVRRNNVLEVYRNGALLNTGVIGSVLQSNPSGSGLWFFGSHSNDGYSLLRVSATPPSADQIAHMYRTELPLFQPNAQCVLDGASNTITALAYDDTTDVLQVGTSWGRSAFHDLVRIESAVSTVGAITSLSANQGSHISAGASSGRYYQPAMLLRDELRRRDEARKALGKVLVEFPFDTIGFAGTTTNGSSQLTSVSVTTGTPYVGMGITGTGIPAGTTIIGISGATYTLSANATASGSGVVLGQYSFNLPKGYTTKGVYSAGSLKRVGSTKDYTTAFDGFVETVNFGTSPGNAVWVSIMAIRSN